MRLRSDQAAAIRGSCSRLTAAARASDAGCRLTRKADVKAGVGVRHPLHDNAFSRFMVSVASRAISATISAAGLTASIKLHD